MYLSKPKVEKARLVKWYLFDVGYIYIDVAKEKFLQLVSSWRDFI